MVQDICTNQIPTLNQSPISVSGLSLVLYTRTLRRKNEQGQQIKVAMAFIFLLFKLTRSYGMLTTVLMNKNSCFLVFTEFSVVMSINTNNSKCVLAKVSTKCYES